MPPPTHQYAANADIFDRLQAATAPFLHDLNSLTHPDVPMYFNTPMAHAGLAGPSNNELGAQATLLPDCVDDATLPELPRSLYGVEFLPEDLETDEEDDRSPPTLDSDPSGEFSKSSVGGRLYTNNLFPRRFG
jgi:hypothetical protein